MNGGFVLLLGMGTVFIGLICLIYISKIMSFIIQKFDKKSADENAIKASQDDSEQTSIVVPQSQVIPDRQQFVAAVSVALAECMGTAVDGIRIHSIKCVSGGGDERGKFVAAVSAAIASSIDSDIGGLRIHSIKQI